MSRAVTLRLWGEDPVFVSIVDFDFDATSSLDITLLRGGALGFALMLSVAWDFVPELSPAMELVLMSLDLNFEYPPRFVSFTSFPPFIPFTSFPSFASFLSLSTLPFSVTPSTTSSPSPTSFTSKKLGRSTSLKSHPSLWTGRRRWRSRR